MTIVILNVVLIVFVVGGILALLGWAIRPRHGTGGGIRAAGEAREPARLARRPDARDLQPKSDLGPAGGFLPPLNPRRRPASPGRYDGSPTSARSASS